MRPAIVLAALCAACGQRADSPPELGAGTSSGTSSGGSGSGSASSGSSSSGLAPDATPAPDASASGGGWRLVGALNAWPGRDTTDLVVVAGSAYATMHGRKWDLATAAESSASFTATPDVTFKSEGCSCLVGMHAYALGGGGDGVTAPWADTAYLDADFAQQALTSHAQPFGSHAVACVTTGQACWVVGGSDSESGPYGTRTVRTFDPSASSFAVSVSLPMPMARVAAALGGGILVAAGGYCSGGGACPASNDPSGQPVTVLSAAFTLDVTSAAASWQPAPSLPHPLSGAGLLFLAGRFYLVGGAASAYGSATSYGVLSWTPGENAWRSDAVAPGTGPIEAVLTDGQSIFAVVAEGSFADDLYRLAPPP